MESDLNSQASEIPEQSEFSKSECPGYYQSFLSKQIKDISENKNLIQKLLRDSAIKYCPSILYPQLKISVLRHSLSFRVLVLRAQLNHFQFQVSILNEEVNSRAHLLQKHQFKYADIYSTEGQKPDFVVKCFRIRPEEDIHNQFCKVLRQFCYYRIAAELKIGPAIAYPFGFDLQVTEECIQFALEKYESIEKSKQIFNDNLQRSQHQLMEKLYILHSLRIVHKNIHPFNILYNKNKKQFYLSDFCFCSYVQQPVGTRTKTAFSGALNYCHEQMVSIFDRSGDSADLYLNDAYCLKESFGYLKKSWQMQLKYERQGRRVRVMEMRDVYEDYGSLYSNIGSFYQKLKSVYQYVFSYYSLLKFFKAIHQQDDSILSNPHFAKVSEMFPFKVLQILKDYQPSQFKARITRMVSPHLRSTSLTQNEEENLGDIKNIFRRQLIKKRQRIIHQADVSSVQKFFQYLNQSMSSLFTFEGDRHIRKAKIERKIVVHSSMFAVKLDRFVYYQQFMKFVDIRQIRSTYDQKNKACQVFIKVLKIKPKQNNLVSEHPQLQICLKQILYELLEKPQDHSQSLIADALTNLIISDTISDFDLYQVLKQMQQRKQEPLRDAEMFFNVYCGIDWVRFKAVNIFDFKKVFQISKKFIYSALVALRHLDPSNEDLNILIRLAVTIIVADSQSVFIIPEIKKIMVEQILQLQNKQVVNQVTANQMISLICLNSVTSREYYTQQDLLKAIEEIQSYRPKLGYDERIYSFHLRMYALLDRFMSDDIRVFSIKNRFWRTLQVPKLLNKYKLFFGEQRSKYNSQQIPRLVKTLQKLSKVEKYKFCKDVILQWRYWLIWIAKTKDSHLEEHYTIKLRKIYTTEALYNMDFPSISADNDFFSFYEHAHQLITFYLALHRSQQRQSTNIVNNFLDQLESHYDALNFEGSQEIKEVVVHFINFIKLQKYALEHRPQQANSILKQAIRQLTIKTTVPWDCAKIYLMQYIDTMLKWAFLYKNNKYRERSFQRAFQALKRYKLISEVFCYNDACKLLAFLNWYSLGAVGQGGAALFLQVHGLVLAGLERHPIAPNIDLYIKSIDELVKGGLIANKAFQIIESIVNRQVQKAQFDPGMDQVKQKLYLSRYDCLLLSGLLQYPSQEHSLIQLAIRHIVLRINSLVSYAQHKILERLFTYRLIVSDNSQNKADKRLAKRSWFEVRRYAKFIQNNDHVSKLVKKLRQLKPFKKKKPEQMVSRLRDYRKKWEGYLQREEEDQEDQEINDEETTQEMVSDL